MYTYRIAKIVGIVSGDVLDLMIDLGFEVLKKARIQLAGVSCALLNSDIGRDALGFTERWVALRMNTPLCIQTSRPREGMAGRYQGTICTAPVSMTEVFCPECLNEDLLTAGKAVPIER